jgi:hypothetical protein
MLFKEIIAVYSDNHTKPKSTKCCLLFIKAGGTTGRKRYDTETRITQYQMDDRYSIPGIGSGQSVHNHIHIPPWPHPASCLI